MPPVGLPSDARSGSGCSYRRLASNCLSAAALLLLGLVWLHVDPEPNPVVRPATAAAARPIGLVTLEAPPLDKALRAARQTVLSRVSGGPRDAAAGGGGDQGAGGGGGDQGAGGGGGGGGGGDPHPPPAGSCQPLGPPLVRAATASNALGLLLVTFVNSAQVELALRWLLLATPHCHSLPLTTARSLA